MRKQLLVLRIERIPGRHVRRTRRQDRILRNDRQLLLARECLLAQLVPALIELALELRDPFLGHVMGRVGRAGRVIREERLVRRQRMLLLDPVDRLIGEIGVEIVVRFGRGGELLLGFDGNRVLEHRGIPLVGVAADESVEIIEPESGGPKVERAVGAALPGRHVMVLAEPRGAVAVAAQNFRRRCPRSWASENRSRDSRGCAP